MESRIDEIGARGMAARRPGKASRIHRFGGPEVIALEDVIPPEPGDGEVLVRVKAAGVGPWDAWVRAGRSALPQPLPLTLGSDISGIVEAAGRGVTGFVPGDAVFGMTNPRFTGGYADYAIASASMLAKKPGILSHVEAASVPVVAVTAWQALFEQAQLSRDQSVLIHGAAGGVGAFAVQLAHTAGLRVYATARGRDVGYVRSLGADTVLDGHTARFEDVFPPVDAVIDLVGGELQMRSYALLHKGGALISTVSPPDRAEATALGVRAAFFLVDVTTGRLSRIGAMIEEGALAAAVGTVLPLADARLAHELLEGTRERPHGKIVLRVSE
jgi:NADPH:quinone reductase-like Zn-dependent oxidoreductase